MLDVFVTRSYNGQEDNHHYQKKDLIFHYGNFVLYSLSTFFLELEQDKATKKLVGRQIFQSGAQLDKYLPNFKVSI